MSSRKTWDEQSTLQRTPQRGGLARGSERPKQEWIQSQETPRGASGSCPSIQPRRPILFSLPGPPCRLESRRRLKIHKRNIPTPIRGRSGVWHARGGERQTADRAWGEANQLTQILGDPVGEETRKTREKKQRFRVISGQAMALSLTHIPGSKRKHPPIIHTPVLLEVCV